MVEVRLGEGDDEDRRGVADRRNFHPLSSSGSLPP